MSGYSIAIIVSVTITSMLALGQFVLPAKEQRNYILLGVYSILAISQTHAFLLTSGLMVVVPTLYRIHLPLLFCIGPLIYFLYLSIFEERIELSTSRMAHFLPAAGLAVFIVADHLSQQLIFPAWQRPGIDWTDVLLLTSLLHVSSYLAYLLFRVLSTERQFERKVMLYLIIFSQIALLTSVVGGILAAAGVKGITWARFTALNGSVLLLVIYVITQRFPNFFRQLEERLRREKYKQSHLQNVNLGEVEARLGRLMNNEKVFLEEKLTLKELAGYVDLTSHQLSEFLSTRLNIRFSHYVNRYRIAEACRKLVSEQEKDILTIAYEVGFNSKATFQAAFARENETTPGAYRKNHGK